MTTRLSPLDIMTRLISFPTVSRDTNLPLVDWVEEYLASHLDPRELDFKFDNAAQFTDLETGQQHFIDPDAARRQYRERLDAHLEAAAAICQRSGIDYFLSPTDRPLDLALFDLLTSRSHRAASPSRTRTNPNMRRAS